MIPANVPMAKALIDPSDVADFIVDLRALLEAGESFAAVTFSVPTESAALGFRILDAAPHLPETLENGRLRIWVTVEESSRLLPVWNGGGASCAIEFTAVTDSVPPRTFQRTIAIKVAQR